MTPSMIEEGLAKPAKVYSPSKLSSRNSSEPLVGKDTNSREAREQQMGAKFGNEVRIWVRNEISVRGEDAEWPLTRQKT